MPQDMNDRFSHSFDDLCPAWVPHRWKYKLEIYEWLLERRDTIRYLFPLLPEETSTEQEAHPDHSFTDVEMEAILIVAKDTPESERYWLSLELVHPVHAWGGRLSGFLHGCDCHEQQLIEGKSISCVEKGRRGSTFAAVGRDRFRRELENMKPPPAAVAKATSSALKLLLVAFVSSINGVCHRFMLVFGFWDKLPWGSFKLYYAEVQQTADAKALVVEWCRQLVQRYEERGSTNVGLVAHRFFDPQHPAGLRSHIDALSHCYVMSVELADELRCYTSGLIVMQLLESRHHLVALALGHGRASKLPKLAADMRRHLNPDLSDNCFRANVDHYMARLQDRTSLLPKVLVDECGASLSNFHAAVYGSHIQVMYGSVKAESQLVDAYKSKVKRVAVPHADKEEDAMIVEYMRTILPERQFFSFQPAQEAGATEQLQPYRFQVVSAHPERKRNIEKISQLGDYSWDGCVAIAQLFPEGASDDKLVMSHGMELDTLNLARCFEDGCHERVSVFRQIGYEPVFKPEDMRMPAICDAERVPALCDVEGAYNMIGDALVANPGMTEEQLAERLPNLSGSAFSSALVELKAQGVIVASCPSMELAGQLVVADAHMSRHLVLAEPISIQDERGRLPLNELSRWELRRRLFVEGWQIADSDNKADLVSKRLMPHRTSLYYQCLLHEKVRYMLGISHSASDGYYNCMIAMMDCHQLEDWTHIPVSKSAQFFCDLEDFLRKVPGASDPRTEDDNRPKKTKLHVDKEEG